jgi:hypothetical protein
MIRMAHYSLAKLHRRQRYKLIADAIVPRPIALVTTPFCPKTRAMTSRRFAVVEVK